MTCPRELNRLMERYNLHNFHEGIGDRAHMTVDGEGRMDGAVLRVNVGRVSEVLGRGEPATVEQQQPALPVVEGV